MKKLNKSISDKIGKGKANWYTLCRDYTLPEEFIRCYRDRVHWRSISIFQNLSLNFIREFKDQLNWFHISEFQMLNEEFIVEFYDVLNLRAIKYRNEDGNLISEDVLDSLMILQKLTKEK